MNKLKVFALFVLISSLVIFSASPAFALQCKTGQSLNSDECFTAVEIEEGYWSTTLGLHEVSRGTIVVASKAGLTTALNDGYKARFSTSSADFSVLGVVQRAITSGESLGMAQTLGRGFVLTAGDGGVASGTPIAITEGVTLASRAGQAVEVILPDGLSTNPNVGRSIIATTLEANTTEDSETASYIHIT